MRLPLLAAFAPLLGLAAGCSDTVPPVTVDLTAVVGEELGARDFALPDFARRPDLAEAAAPPDLAPCIPSPPVPAKVKVPDTCKMGRWTWQNPLPQPNRLWAVHGASANDAWAVGQARTLLHWDGKLWSRVVLPWARRIQA